MGGVKSQAGLEFGPETKSWAQRAGLGGVTEKDSRGLREEGSHWLGSEQQLGSWSWHPGPLNGLKLEGAISGCHTCHLHHHQECYTLSFYI